MSSLLGINRCPAPIRDRLVLDAPFLVPARFVYFLASFAIAGVPCATAFAGVTAFSGQQQWQAALAAKGYNTTTETFDGLSIPSMTPDNGPHVIIPEQNAFSIGLSISVEGVPRNADDAFIADGLFHGELFPETGHTAYVHDFSRGIIAFGQNYKNPASGRGIRLSSSEGEIDIFVDSEISGFDDGFFGFIADEPIASVQVIASDGDTAGELYDAFDVQFAEFPIIQPDTSGDYNRDGRVDLADYTLWRDTLGTTGLSPGFGADGNRDRVITIEDYEIWKHNFEAPTLDFRPVRTVVPEPNSFAYMALPVLLLVRSSCSRVA